MIEAAFLHDVLKHPRRSVYVALDNGRGGRVDPSEVAAILPDGDGYAMHFRDGGEVRISRAARDAYNSEVTP